MIDLLQKNHLLRVGEVLGVQLVEVNATGDVGSIPTHDMLTGLLMAVN